MKLKRFYFNKSMMNDGIINLSGDEFNHAINVLRLRVGNKAVLFCGDGLDYVCEVATINKKEATFKVDEIIKNDSEANCCLTVYQALAKGEKLNLIVQKLTEIGVNSFKTFHSTYCDVKPNTKKMEKFESVVISACKQCGRSELMKTDYSVLKFDEMLKEISGFDVCFFAYENSKDENLFNELINLRNKKKLNLALIVGPEGGFSDEEAELLKVSGATTVSLGKRILRTETCAIMASGMIIQAFEKCK